MAVNVKKNRNELARSGRRGAAWCGLAGAVLLCLPLPVAHSQGPLRRLGDRIRERTGGPILPEGLLRDAISPQSPATTPRAGSPGSQPESNLPAAPLNGVRQESARPIPGLQPIGNNRSANFRRPGSSPAPSRDAPAAPPTPRPPALSPAPDSTNIPDPFSARPPDPTPPPTESTGSASGLDPAANLSLDRLGMTVAATPADTAPGTSARRPRGAVVAETLPRSPAARSGLRPGDRVVSVDGRLVRTAEDLVGELSRFEPGQTASLHYSRDERLDVARVTLATPEAIAAAVESGADETPKPADNGGRGRSFFDGFGSALGGLLGGRQESPVPAAVPSTPAENPSADSPDATKPDAANPSAVVPEELPAPAPTLDPLSNP